MYAKIINEETKLCDVGLGINTEFYKSVGMTEMEVEQAYDGCWYVKGYAPTKPQELINKQRITELKQFLADTDYIILKINESLDESEKQDLIEKYADIIKQRRDARIEINNLEKDIR